MADTVIEPTVAPADTAAPTVTPEPQAPVTTAEPKPALAPEPQPQTVPLSRLNQEVAKRRNLEREIEYLQRASQPAAPQAPPQEPSEPKMKDFGDETDPVAVKRFNEAWVDHRAERKLQEFKQRTAQEQVEQSERAAEMEAGRKLKEKLLEASTSNPGIHDAVEMFDSYRFHKYINLAVANSDKNVALIDFMANNPGEAFRLRNMPVPNALTELGRIESRLQSGSGKPEPKITRAPAPPEPVSTEHQTLDIARMSQKEYDKYMNKKTQGY